MVIYTKFDPRIVVYSFCCLIFLALSYLTKNSYIDIKEVTVYGAKFSPTLQSDLQFIFSIVSIFFAIAVHVFWSSAIALDLLSAFESSRPRSAADDSASKLPTASEESSAGGTESIRSRSEKQMESNVENNSLILAIEKKVIYANFLYKYFIVYLPVTSSILWFIFSLLCLIKKFLAYFACFC